MNQTVPFLETVTRPLILVYLVQMESTHLLALQAMVVQLSSLFLLSMELGVAEMLHLC